MATLKELMSGDADVSQTDAISRLLAAKGGNLAAGTGTGGGAVRRENVLEQSVGQEVGVAKAQEAQKFGQAEQAQAQQQAAQAAQAGQAQQALAGQEQQKIQAAANQAQEVLTSLENGKDQLSLQEKAGLEESAATALRLSNEKYISDLQITATKNRITTMADAQMSLLTDQLEDMTDILSSGIRMSELLQMDDQQFRRELARMNVKDAKSLAEKKMEQASKEQMYAGVSGMIQGGGGVASKFIK